MSLFDLANELLVAIGQFLDAERDIDAFAKSSKRLYAILIAHLYRYNAHNSSASALVWAAKSGRVETLQRAVATGVRVHEFALLPAASEEGHAGIVRLLLATPGADADVKNQGGWTSLAAASRQGHVDVVKLLLEANADLQTNYAGWTPLNVAANDGHAEVVKLLLAKGAGVSAPSDTGWTPLKSAACNGHLEVVKLLLTHGADVHATADQMWTPLHSAANSGHGDVVELLMDHGADSAVATADGWTPLTLAADQGMEEAVQTLLAKGADVALPGGNGWTPITLASDSGRVAVVQILLDKGADVNSTCNNGWTPLTLASASGHVAVVALLLRRGADIRATNDSGWSSLLIASDRGHRDVVESLLAHGADVSTTSVAGLTALQAASENGNLEVAELLLDKGADTSAANRSGWNALHIAAHNSHCRLVELLLSTPGVEPDAKDNNGRTASYHAAMRGNADVVDLFLARAVSLTIPDCYGSKPIFSAVRNGHEAVARRLLAAHSYTANHLDGFGRNLLWWARRSGRPGLVRLVWQHVRMQDQGLEPDDDMEPEENPIKFVKDACWCEVCTRCTVLGTTSYECPSCDGGYFLVCAECYDTGVRCRESSHHLIPHSCNRVA
ncbi:hypothetical protein ED733_000524 [Metarhizium rileyi]|uniref:Uncharacterized protein n=1 Tax=Metarhizium rileyi (strain RCEF 4871) TaxID=1649241 RepID=A0A5C6G1Z9_METRR|nr:hypothetical protein ED733_000524 [Metarhizium rileyi]